MVKKSSSGAAKREPESLTPEKVIKRRIDKLQTRMELRALIRKLVIIALVAWAALTFVFGIGRVNGEDMYPRLRDGDLTVYFRLARNYNLGDIAVFEINGERVYGRIVAQGGDTVDFSADGLLILNGSAQQEEVFFPTTKDGRAVSFPLTLAQDEVFVLCDNRENATDSRDFGPIKVSALEGSVISVMRRREL